MACEKDLVHQVKTAKTQLNNTPLSGEINLCCLDEKIGTTPTQPYDAAHAVFKKGLILRFKKEIPQAIRVIEKAHRLFTRRQNPGGIVFATLELAWLYGSIHNHSQSNALFTDAQNQLAQNPRTPQMNEARARLLHYKGLLLYQKEQYSQAIKTFKEALDYCRLDGLEAAKIYDSLGVHYERTGDFHRAVRFLKSALYIKTTLGDLAHEEAVTCQILGRLYLLYEDYELALRHLEQSHAISTKLKDEKRRGALQNEMTRLFLRCGQDTHAFRMIELTRAQCRNRYLRLQYGMASFYDAFLQFRRQQTHLARIRLKQDVIPIFERLNYVKGLGMVKRLQAWILLATEPAESAQSIALMGEAIALFRQNNLIDEVAKTHLELGKLYTQTGHRELALASYLDTLQLAEENGLFYLNPYVEDEIFRTHEEHWHEIVMKRSRHERLFEKRHSLIDALTEMMRQPDSASPAMGATDGFPFLVSLLKVGEVMAQERELEQLLTRIGQEVAEALHADDCRIYLSDESGNQLHQKQDGKVIQIPAHLGLCGYVLKTGKLVNITDTEMDPRFSAQCDQHGATPVSSLLCLPICNRKGDTIGVFHVVNKKTGTFDRSDEALLGAIASSAGIAIENAQLNAELQMTFESMISTLSSTIDARDPITAGHSQRVMEYALIIGRHMNLPQTELDVLKYAALLHDIGKIGVKEEILTKPGRLTEQEYEHIQKHVYYTYEILKNIHFEKRLASIPEVAASHHEKLDGTGYFRKLKGEGIPLGGRILAVADVFDAITSRRPYRNRMPFIRAVSTLQEEAGTHFDPQIVDVFLSCRTKDIAKVLCMDNPLNISQDAIDAALASIPKQITLAQMVALYSKDNRTDADQTVCEAFSQLYNFAEISNSD